MRLHPGDMQFVHNHTLLHDRTAFTDHDDPALKRHLLRAWITTPVVRAFVRLAVVMWNLIKLVAHAQRTYGTLLLPPPHR
jgi:Taurine catabolism dioxygenase TauD, TfdA family